MYSLTNYGGTGLLVVTPTPTGAGGAALNANFMALSTKISTTDPIGSNDGTQGFGVGSRWFNTTTNNEWICTNNATGLAQWVVVMNTIRNGTSSALSGVTLPVAEQAYATDTGKLAIGDGATTFANLAGFGGLGNVLTIFGTSIQLGTGGNTRGTNSLDLQNSRTTASEVASGEYSFLRGTNSTASGNFSTANGSVTFATGGYSTASGPENRAAGDYSTAIGYSTYASGKYSTASGYVSTASGTYSTASGYYAVATGTYSTANGYYTTASGSYSNASGLMANASKRGQFARNSFAFSALGDNQGTCTHLGAATSNATQTELTTDGLRRAVQLNRPATGFWSRPAKAMVA